MNNMKIVIVGGGSAGWMTATTLIKCFPHYDITVIESPNTPTVGVGESTIGQINNWLSLIGIKEKEFIKCTDATYKLSIRFENFYKKGEFFHYPFGTPELSGTFVGLNDWYFKKFLYPETPHTNYVESYYPAMGLINNGTYSDNKDGLLKSFNPEQDVAYHFDATKFGLFLKSNYCLNKGVKYIVADVTNTKVTNDGIEELVLDGFQTVKADLFIDCTGFKSLLLSKALEEPFESYEDLLPNNSAVATRIPYRNKEKELVGYTNCIAHNNGWIWQIPLWSRIGSGYVYSDKFISDAEAVSEFKDFLKERNYPIEDCEFKTIKMRIGIHNRIFVKNVCAIGLSAGFIEPLESNGLFTVHEFLLHLVRLLKRGSISRFDKDAFNYTCKTVFRNFAEFVAIHYALSHREDTPYWKAIKNKEFSYSLNNCLPEVFNGLQKAVNDKAFYYTHPDTGGLHCVAVGMNWNATDFESISYARLNNDIEFWKPAWNITSKKLTENKENWDKVSKTKPKLFNYLQDNFYK